jgi:DNA-directed RNA polymerase subunit alpha
LQESTTPKIDTLHTSDDFGRFQIEPLARGFGITIGNAMRRVLLSSLQGAAVTAVKVEGVFHEFATIPGVKEDTTELILNLKQLRVQCHSDQPAQMRLIANGPGVVTAADLIYPSDIEIINPELHLATLDGPDSRLEMELTVERGTGYLPSDGREPPSLGVIPIDAIFSPVRRVNYTVENTRVGSRIDLDRVIIDIQTDGTVTPIDALAQAAGLLIDHFTLFTDLQKPPRLSEKPTLGTGAIPTQIYEMSIDQLELSQRTHNCLKRSQITKVGQILQMSEDELLSLRNFGQKSLDELREKLAMHGLITGTDGLRPASGAGNSDDDDTDPEPASQDFALVLEDDDEDGSGR